MREEGEVVWNMWRVSQGGRRGDVLIDIHTPFGYRATSRVSVCVRALPCLQADFTRVPFDWRDMTPMGEESPAPRTWGSGAGGTSDGVGSDGGDGVGVEEMGQERQERAPVLQKKHCVQYRVAVVDSDAPSAEVEDGAGSGGREDV